MSEPPADPTTEANDRPLAGSRVVVTRERPGTLGALLAERGATVVHVPLIEVTDPDDGGSELEDALSDLQAVDWVLVTSAPGAERAAAALGDRSGDVALGCVGTATAARWQELSGRPADLVPERQLAASLATAFVDAHRDAPGQRVVVAQADRAGTDLVVGLRSAGHHVTAITAYRTVTRRPSPAEFDLLEDADAVLFASGSAVAGWFEALGDDARSALPPIVVAIGPSTAETADDYDLKIRTIAADHSVPGLVAALESVWRQVD